MINIFLFFLFGFVIYMSFHCTNPNRKTITFRSYRLFKKDWSDIADHVRLDTQMLKADKALYAVDPEFAIEMGYIPPSLERIKCEQCGEEDYRKNMEKYLPFSKIPVKEKIICPSCVEKEKKKEKESNQRRSEHRICIGCGNTIPNDMPCSICYKNDLWRTEYEYHKRMIDKQAEHYLYHSAPTYKTSKWDDCYVKRSIDTEDVQWS